MNKILLSTVAAFAFAGAASAEVTLSGDAELGYNDDVEGGFYWSAGATISGSTELNNGLTAGFSIDFDLVSGDEGGITDPDHMDFEGYSVYVKNDTYGLHFGDVQQAAHKHWASAGSMAMDGFTEDGEEAIRLDGSFGGVSASISAETPTNGGDTDNLAFGATAALGNFDIRVAYEDFGGSNLTGVSLGTSFGGADVRLAYATDGTDSSTGVSVSYPVGPVTLGASYVAESAAAVDDAWEVSVGYAEGALSVDASYGSEGGVESYAIDGSYDMGNGIVVNAGYTGDNGTEADTGAYVGMSYDLGGGASFLASYAVAAVDGDSDIGAPEYKDGLTLALSLAF